ncbi:MAG: winged helix-turn-helix domain-containing protein [Candidatus Pacearchaeota archaeon]|jgi:predicted transcriptional regulator
MVKRGKLEIIRDILKIVQDNKNSIKPTPLLRKSSLSSSSFKEYYTELLERQLITEVQIKNDKFVVLTDKGFKFIERYKSIAEFIDEFEL